jgi:hypothetical protein
MGREEKMRSKMRRITIGMVALAAICTLSMGVVQAEEVAVPSIINYQGKLTNPTDGSPVESGVYHIEFRIWNDPIGNDATNLIWGKVFAVHVVTNGLFNILLSDDGTPVTAPSAQTNDLKQAFQGENRYLGLTITQGPSGSIASPEISPRQKMVSAPFAFHAQNATHSFKAEQADEATLAHDSDKLGGTLANEFYDNARFNNVGLSGAYRTILGWESGGIASQLGLFAYGGRYCIGGIAEDPGVGVKLLIKDEKLKVEQGIVSEGAILASAGEPNQGIQFPKNIEGGTGDGAWIQYYNVTNEDCKLEIVVENDSGDEMELRASGNITLDSGRDIEMKGTVRAFGGITEVHNLLTQGGTYDVYAPSDGFYYINADNISYTVILAGYSWYLRSVRDDDWNIQMQSYPIAKGEHFKVSLNDNFDGNSHLKVYWRPFGR